MSKKLGLFLAGIVAIVFLQGCGDEGYYEEKVFIASGHPDWSPIMYQSEDKIVGAGPELVALIFDELGLAVQSRFVGPWDVVQEKAKSGEVDLIVAAYKTAERETYLEYSNAYTVDPVAIFVKKGESFPFENWNELLDKKGVVTRGDSYGQAFDDFLAQNLEVVVVDSSDEAFALITKGDADYFVYALYSGEKALQENKDLSEQVEILSNYVSTEDFFITISKKSELVGSLPQINQILQRLIDDGTVDRLIEENKNK